MSNVLNAIAGALGVLYRDTLVVRRVMSAGELTLTIMRKNGTRAVNRQSRDDFVPERGIMLQNDPYFLFLYFTLLFLVM